MKGKLAALNVEVQGPFVAMPDGVRLELLEEKAQTSPIVMHHIHLTAFNGEMLRQWYIKTFGAEAGSRRDLPSAKFNGNEVDFVSQWRDRVRCHQRPCDRSHRFRGEEPLSSL